jgi:hypothetical protein
MVTNENSMMQLQQTVIHDEQYQPSTIQSAASTQFKANRKSSTSDSLVKPDFIMKKSQDASDGSELIGISNKLANIVQNDRSETQQPISYSSKVSSINQVEEIEQFDHSAPRSHLVTTTTREIFPKSAPPQLFTARPKPMPPNQAEVQALISNLIAKKRPGTGFLYPHIK